MHADDTSILNTGINTGQLKAATYTNTRRVKQ